MEAPNCASLSPGFFMRGTPRILRSFQGQRRTRKLRLGRSFWGARRDGKLLIDLPWDQNASRFADAIEAVIACIEAAHRSSAEAS